MSDAFVPMFGLPIAAIICGVLTRLIRRWALRREFVDLPGGHKGHAVPVALGGGVAVTVAIVLPIALGILAANILATTDPQWLPDVIATHLDGVVAKTPVAIGMIAAMLTVCFMGLVDDARPLSPAVKLAIQFAVALLVVQGCGLRLMSHLGLLPSAALTILWILILTNALNFLDNMDGLAVGVALICATIFAITASLAGQLFVPACCWLLVGAAAGFLPFNIHPASIYLGDAGSQVLGLLLAMLTILTTFADPSLGQSPVGVLAPLVVMAVPLYDTGSVIILRWRIGAPVWTGDRRHFSHRLLRRGYGVRKAVMVIWLATLVTGLPAILLPRLAWDQAWIILLQTVLVVALVAVLEGSGWRDETPV